MPALQDNTSVAASWMEHQILEHVKQAMRVTLDWQAPVVSVPRKLSSLQFTIKSFQRHLERVMAIEEEGGYMVVVADAKPYMQERIDRLASEHDRFRMQICEITPLLEEVNEWDEDRFHEICNEIRELLNAIDRHDASEIDLLQETLLMDVGGEG